jgi:hypothetical protein
MHRPEYTRINFGDVGVKRIDYTKARRCCLQRKKGKSL